MIMCFSTKRKRLSKDFITQATDDFFNITKVKRRCVIKENLIILRILYLRNEQRKCRPLIKEIS